MNKKKIITLIIMAMLASNTVACSTQSKQKESTQTMKSTIKQPDTLPKKTTKEDINKQETPNDILDNEKTKEMVADDISLTIKDKKLTLNCLDSQIELTQMSDINYYHYKPSCKVIYSDEQYKYILVTYGQIFCGGAGVDNDFFIIRHSIKDNELKLLCSSKETNSLKLEPSISKDKTIVTITADGINVDIPLINIPKHKLDNLSNSEIVNVSNSIIEINDYDLDGINELFIRCEIEDVVNSIELTSLYIFVEINQDGLKINNIIAEELNNFVLIDIGKNGFCDLDNGDFIDEDCRTKAKNQAELLLKKEIIIKQDDKLYLKP